MAQTSRSQIIRHLLMRLMMGFILGWFGGLQVRSQSDWVDFVPDFISRLSPIADSYLIFLHGSLLLLAAVGIFLGLRFAAASLLATILLSFIIFTLIVGEGSVNLIVRDIGILGLAIGLTFDPVRFWQLDTAQWLAWRKIRIGKGKFQT